MKDLLSFLDPEFLIRTAGLVGIFAIVFAESGLLIGFFFPGDSLLFTAGILAPALDINIYVLAIGVVIMAILGDSTGYWFGKKVGPALFSREDSLIFKKERLEKAEKFFAEHGARAIILARFMPIFRTFVPIIAGVAKMNYKTFLTFNIIGGILWGAGFTTLGYILGSTIPNIEKYVGYIIAVIIITSVFPVISHLFKEYRNKSKN